jgi:hypothetical protein
VSEQLCMKARARTKYTRYCLGRENSKDECSSRKIENSLTLDTQYHCVTTGSYRGHKSELELYRTVLYSEVLAHAISRESILDIDNIQYHCDGVREKASVHTSAFDSDKKLPGRYGYGDRYICSWNSQATG